ncbi:TPA: hypothetical protein GDO54_018421 [Pyxicephalus adspersus]|uniref:Uncharacterized protein n=1 Tax=Pyxicephalus adspersus TaxID=30357 RepID=A0AAV2ZPG9_PYXAD|nr:TPA: hypothetical protein GDO54_018421 [Pyxicephalus adspersus]
MWKRTHKASLISCTILFSSGENWKVMRRFTLSTLRDYGMGKKTIEDKITEEAECLVQVFQSYGGEYLQFQIRPNFMVKNSVVILYNSFPFLVGLLPGSHKKLVENFSHFRNFITATFTKQRNELDVNNQRSLIDTFLAKQQEGNPESSLYYHDENLTALVFNLFSAGMETTSTTLRWGLLLMMKYPDIRKVQDEIERVIGTTQPKLEHRKQMPYTDAVIHESLRYVDIGTTVIPVLSSSLRYKAYFEKPYEFFPEHFLDSEGNFKKNDAFIPFSIGKRSCAGEKLARMELFLFFTTLLQRFTYKAPPGAVLDPTPAPGSLNGPLPYEICAISRA